MEIMLTFKIPLVVEKLISVDNVDDLPEAAVDAWRNLLNGGIIEMLKSADGFDVDEFEGIDYPLVKDENGDDVDMEDFVADWHDEHDNEDNSDEEE